jgi:hypothetical protein
MAFQEYAKLPVEVDGRKSDQIQSVTLETESGKLEVYTIETGLAGFTPGPGKCTITLEYAVPAGGFEEPFQQWCCELGAHTLQIGVGPEAYVGEGEFMQDKLSMSAQQSASGSVTWVGEKKKIE